MGRIEELMERNGIRLPPHRKSKKKTVPLRLVGDLVFLSGHGCEGEDGEPIYRGQVGDSLTVEQGYAAARQCGLNLLATLREHLGSLDRVGAS